MPVDVLTQAVIRRPRAEVAAFAGDPANAPRWYANIQSVDRMTSGPVGAGSRMVFVAHFLGRRLEYTYEVTAFDPDQRLVMRTAEGPFPMETTYTWEDAGEAATRMTLRNRGNPSGFSRFLSPFMAMAIRRANQKDLANLKAILEQ